MKLQSARGSSVTVLSDRDIQAAIDNGDLGISTPRNKEVLIQPSSIDLRLSPSIQVVRSELADGGEFINPTRLNNIQEKLRNLTETLELKHDQPFVLQPGSFVLGTTAERVTLSNKLAAEGRRQELPSEVRHRRSSNGTEDRPRVVQQHHPRNSKPWSTQSNARTVHGDCGAHCRDT